MVTVQHNTHQIEPPQLIFPPKSSGAFIEDPDFKNKCYKMKTFLSFDRFMAVISPTFQASKFVTNTAFSYFWKGSISNIWTEPHKDRHIVSREGTISRVIETFVGCYWLLFKLRWVSFPLRFPILYFVRWPNSLPSSLFPGESFSDNRGHFVQHAILKTLVPSFGSPSPPYAGRAFQGTTFSPGTDMI